MNKKVLITFYEDKEEITVTHNCKEKSEMHALLLQALIYSLDKHTRKEIPVTVIKQDLKEIEV